MNESVAYLPALVQSTVRSYGRFDLGSIPAVERGARILALVGDKAGLAEMDRVVRSLPELAPWAEAAHEAQEDIELIAGILRAVENSPGCLQTDLKSLMGLNEGMNLGTLVGYLEKAGRLGRTRVGKTYSLHLPGSPDFPQAIEKRDVKSHRTDTKPPPLQEIEISTLDYVPLPRSPDRWEEAQKERAVKLAVKAQFEVLDADWSLQSVEKIPPGERPDGAYRAFYPSGAGLFCIDDLGKAEGIGPAPASALRYGRDGKVAVQGPFEFDLYRIGVHPLGRGLIASSRDGVLHAYDENLKSILETNLLLAPEVVAIRKRFDIGVSEFKNHLRCTTLSCDETRYLFTIVDEAWCVSLDGKGLWGAKLPMKEGWSRTPPSQSYGTSAAVDRALKVMDLSFPFTPEDLKSRYRQLARQWHPDLNRSDPGAADKMVALNAAVEALTGLDGSAIPSFTSSNRAGTAEKKLDLAGALQGFSFSIVVSEKFASDWIYAATFASASNGAYLAGYSGRVIYVDDAGKAIRVYDIGAIPRQIVDTGKFLYLLTATRLYVLKDDQLHALIDTFESGDLIVAENGFALLEKKQVRFFTSEGAYGGTVLAKDPIRRVYPSPNGLIIETRQHRATLNGAAGWLL